MIEENNETTNVKMARMEVKVENLTKSQEDLKDEVKSQRKEALHIKEEILSKINEQPEVLRMKMNDHFNAVVSSHLEKQGAKLFADKETEKIVKGGIKWWLGSSLVAIFSLIVIVAILIQALKNEQAEIQTITSERPIPSIVLE